MDSARFARLQQEMNREFGRRRTWRDYVSEVRRWWNV